MEVECKAEKSQGERERTVSPSQPSSLEPTLEMQCNGFLFSSAHNHEALHAAFQDPCTHKSDPALQGVNSDVRTLKSRTHKKRKTAPGQRTWEPWSQAKATTS